MLVGEPPFAGSTAQAVLGKIIAGKRVSATEERPSVPANVDGAIRKALEKLAADRFASAQDFARALGDEHFRHGELTEGEAWASAGSWKWLTAGLATTTMIFALTAGWALLRPEPPELVRRFSLARDEGQVPSEWLSVSPDGSAMVLRYPNEDGQQQLWLRRFGSDLAPTPIPGTEGEAFDPIISPNGEEVAFVQDGRLKAAPLRGGVIRVLADSAQCCIRWGPDGFVYYSDRSWGIRRVPVTGVDGVGESVIQREESDGNLAYFQVLPGGEVAVFTVRAPPTRIEAIRLDTKERKIVAPGGMRAYVTPTGHLVFATAEGQILAAPFDSEAMETTGPAVSLIEGVHIRDWDPSFSLSDSGTLAYWLAGNESQLDWISPSGAVEPVDPSWSFETGSGTFAAALSPDDERLALQVETRSGLDIWIRTLSTGAMQKLTFWEGEERSPTWSPDGRTITFVSDRSSGIARDWDVWRVSADFTGIPELVYDLDESVGEAVMSPVDQNRLIVRTTPLEGGPGGRDILDIDLGSGSAPRPILAEEYDEWNPRLSPDGRWLAYITGETGQLEVYVRSYPDVNVQRERVSVGGGVAPSWARDGSRRLYYTNPNREMVSVTYEAEPSFAVVDQEILFQLPAGYRVRGGRPFAMGLDGRFLVLRASASDQLVVVSNWFEELRERMGN